MLTPSSNTVLEPVTSAMLSGLPDVTAHFARFPVTEISLSNRGLEQFDIRPAIEAAKLVAHANVQVIAWNGTSAGWLGLQRDHDLCEAIEAHTGVKGTSSTLALADIFRRTGVKTYGLVTPYLDAVQKKIIATFDAEGWRCGAERHLDEQRNFSFSDVSAARIHDMVGEVAQARPDAIAIFCTNLRGAPLVAELEAEFDLPIYDTVATALWSSLRLAGVDPSRIRGWGRLFDSVA
jgi:maleate isomerase